MCCAVCVLTKQEKPLFVVKSSVAGHDNTNKNESVSAIEPLHDYVTGCAVDNDTVRAST